MMSELQNRLVTRVFAGRHQLPSRPVMKEWMDKQRQYFKDKTDGKFMVLALFFFFGITTFHLCIKP